MMELVKHNLGLKILSLAMALAVWGFTVVSDPLEEWPLKLDLVVRLAPGMALASLKPDNRVVEVYVRGRSSQLNKLQRSNPRVILDARSVKHGESSEIQPKLEPAIVGIRAEFAQSSFNISVEELSRKEFVPEELTEGRLPAEYFIESRYGLPQRITVEGAKSLVEMVARVAYKINLSALTGSTELSVKFIPFDINGNEIRNLTLIPATADIAIDLRASQATKKVPVVIDYQGSPAANYQVTSLSTDPFMVEVSGPPEVLFQVRNVHTTPVNLTGKTSSFQQRVGLIPPIKGVTLSQSGVLLSVQIEQVSVLTSFTDLEIQLMGSSPTFSYKLSPDKVDVTVESGIGARANIDADQIRPKVDVLGLGPGTFTLKISVSLPAGVILNKVDPEEISVTVTRQLGAPTIPGDDEESADRPPRTPDNG